MTGLLPLWSRVEAAAGGGKVGRQGTCRPRMRAWARCRGPCAASTMHCIAHNVRAMRANAATRLLVAPCIARLARINAPARALPMHPTPHLPRIRPAPQALELLSAGLLLGSGLGVVVPEGFNGFAEGGAQVRGGVGQGCHRDGPRTAGRGGTDAWEWM